MRWSKKCEPWYDGPIGSQMRDIWWETKCVSKAVANINGVIVCLTLLGAIAQMFALPGADNILLQFMLFAVYACMYAVNRCEHTRTCHFLRGCGLNADRAWQLICMWRRCSMILPDQTVRPEYQWPLENKPEAAQCSDGSFMVSYGYRSITGSDHVRVAQAGLWMLAADQAEQDAANRVANRLIELGFSINTDRSKDDAWRVELTWPRPLDRKEWFRATNLDAWLKALNTLPQRLAEHHEEEEAAALRAAREQALAARAQTVLADMNRILGESGIPGSGLSLTVPDGANDASLTVADRLIGLETDSSPVNA